MRMKTETKEEKAHAEELAESVEKFGTARVSSENGVFTCLSIIGEIEGHECSAQNMKTTKYEHILPLLTAIEESAEIDGLLILLNTVGGDVEAGLAIAELISGMSKPTVSLVLGGGGALKDARGAAEAQFFASSESISAERSLPTFVRRALSVLPCWNLKRGTKWALPAPAISLPRSWANTAI